jgi:hypothetical protein
VTGVDLAEGEWRRNAMALFGWSCLGWIILTWTRTPEQLIFGAVVAVAVAVALALGHLSVPGGSFTPRSAPRHLRLVLVTAGRIVMANVKLSARIWSPRRLLYSPSEEPSAHAGARSPKEVGHLLNLALINGRPVNDGRKTAR